MRSNAGSTQRGGRRNGKREEEKIQLTLCPHCARGLKPRAGDPSARPQSSCGSAVPRRDRPHPPGEASVLRAAHTVTPRPPALCPQALFSPAQNLPIHPKASLLCFSQPRSGTATSAVPAPQHRPGTVPAVQSTGASCTLPPSTAQEVCHKIQARFGFLLHLITFPAHPHLPLRAHPAAGAQHPASALCAPNGSGRGAVLRASASPYKSSQKAKIHNHKTTTAGLASPRGHRTQQGCPDPMLHGALTGRAICCAFFFSPLFFFF